MNLIKKSKRTAIITTVLNTLVNPFAIPGYIILGAVTAVNAIAEAEGAYEAQPLYMAASGVDRMTMVGACAIMRANGNAEQLQAMADLRKDLEETEV